MRWIHRRLDQLGRFARSAYCLRDLPAAFLLGIARGSPFNGSSVIGSFGQRWFRVVSARPKLLQGRRVWIDTGDLGQLISYEEIFVDGCYDLGLVPFFPSQVIDCGAHVGLFTRLAAARFPAAQLLVFEPNPQNCAMLRRQIAPFASRVRLVEAALDVTEGEAWFAAIFSNTGRLVHGTPATVGAVKVAVTDLRKHLSPDHSSVVLKIDIEGAEEQVLRACLPLLPRTCAIFFESHWGPLARQLLLTEFQRYGFAVQWQRIRHLYADGLALRI